MIKKGLRVKVIAGKDKKKRARSLKLIDLTIEQKLRI